MKKLKTFVISSFAISVLCACNPIEIATNVTNSVNNSSKEINVAQEHVSAQHATSTIIKPVPPKPIEKTTITLSAAGDFTIGSDDSFGYDGTFKHEADRNGLSFFTKNIKTLFNEDDFTTVNLETTLTTSNQKAEKTFRFKGDPSYTQILTEGSIEAVNLANNHIYDYLQKGFQDTVTNLQASNVGYFGNGYQHLSTVKGIKIGALGYNGWNDTNEIRSQIKGDIQNLRDQGAQIVLVHFHWGEERSYVPNATQKSLGRFTIDSGADLVLGHHPHVLQGIEEYNGKFIVYSLGNFMFGGNRNPSDKDTMVFQQVFHLEDGKLLDQKEINIIPFSISSVTSRNNYQPTPLQGAEAKRVMSKVLDLSARISEPIWVAYEGSKK